MKLTKKTIDKLKAPSSGEKVFFDDEVKGFAIRIRNSGTKSFVYFYRHQGRLIRYTIGKVNSIELGLARNIAKEKYLEVSKGLNPTLEKEKRRSRLKTINELIERYLEEHAKVKNKPSSIRINQYYINGLLNEKYGNKAVKEIDTAFCHEYQQQAIKIFGRISSNRALSLLSKMFNLAKKWGWVEGDNPVYSVERIKEVPRKVWATKDKLRNILKAIGKADNIYYRNYFFMICLLGNRSDETRLMKWEDIDEDNVWTIPGTTTKNGNPHRVPLTNKAIEILNNTPRSYNPYVFMSQKVENIPINGIGKAWRKIRKEANADDIRLHDIRRTIGSYLYQSGVSIQEIGGIFNHKSKATTEIYTHLVEDDRSKKKVLNEVSDTIGKLMPT